MAMAHLDGTNVGPHINDNLEAGGGDPSSPRKYIYVYIKNNVKNTENKAIFFKWPQ